MILLEKEFESNPTSAGLHTFRQIRSGVQNHDGNLRNVYTYQRIDKSGKTFGYEVVIPQVVKAGTVQKFPNGSTRTVEDDTEFYPGTSSFGSRAWFCINEANADDRFDLVINGPKEQPIKVQSTPKKEKPINEASHIQIPGSEFSIGDLANQTGIGYSLVYIWAKKEIEKGTIRFVRKERRAAKGKLTSVFARA
jgi:hypothetical protein